MEYKAYLFDFDYTLVDATPGIVACFNGAFAQLGLPEFSQEAIRRTVGLSLKDAMKVLTNRQDDELSAEFVARFSVLADEVMTDSTALFPDTIPALRALRRNGAKIAIVTNKLHRRITDVLKKHAIADVVDCIIGFEDVTTPKPDPEGIHKAMRHLFVEPADVLYIGDTVIDANAAANANVHFAAVTTGTTTHVDFAPLPHVAIAASLTELFYR